MSNYFGIEQSLIKMAKVAIGSTPTSFPDQDLTQAEKGEGLWLQVSNLRGVSEPVTMGDKGEDNHPGILQIDICYPRGKGAGFILKKADALALTLKAGHSFTHNEQRVTISATSLGGAREVGGYSKMSLSINYYSRTPRNP